VCSVLVVSLNTTMEKIGYVVRNVSDGRTQCVQICRKILFVKLFRDKHCSVLFIVFIFFICNFFNSVTILCEFCVNYSNPQIRNTRARLIRGYDAFNGTTFTQVFLFLIYDVYVTIVCTLNKCSYACVLKSFTAFLV
jgi:hypothetical protein